MKLYNDRDDNRFSIRHIKVKDRKVGLAFAYALR